jgi:hypothetical protein
MSKVYRLSFGDVVDSEREKAFSSSTGVSTKKTITSSRPGLCTQHTGRAAGRRAGATLHRNVTLLGALASRLGSPPVVVSSAAVAWSVWLRIKIRNPSIRFVFGQELKEVLEPCLCSVWCCRINVIRAMPYERHPDLKTPPNEKVLWRYMDFARFVDLLENRGLWFSRLDRLGDPLEGSHTDAERANIRKYLERERAESLLRIFTSGRKDLFVNCWREGRSESLAMWDLYGKGSGIVAINTTVGRLKQAVSMYQEPVFISRLRYVDWNDAPGLDNVLVACSRKDLSYQHEAEVRAIIMGVKQRTRRLRGIRVGVRVKDLITRVIVGPREEEWVVRLVKQVMKKYELSQSVVRSDRLTPRR